MILTVTTTTVTTVTTIGVGSFTLVAVCTLLLLLLNKEILLVSDRQVAGRLRKALNVAIVPLMIIFLTTAVMKVVEALS